MTFLHPEFIYLMLPPVLVLFYFILTQKEPMADYFDDETLKKLRVDEKRLTLRQRNLLYLAVFILLILAMAQPVIEEARYKVGASRPSVVAAIDISASMRTPDVYPSRLAAAVKKAEVFVEAAGREKIALLAFGRDVYLVSPFTRDRRALHRLLEGLDVSGTGERGTDLMAVLEAAAGMLEKEPVKNVFLLTDGGRNGGLEAEAAYARAHGLRLYILGTGTAGGTITDENGTAVPQPLNPALRDLAEATGGAYATEVSGQRDVLRLLSLMRKRGGADEKEREVVRYGQLFVLPLGFALFLLLLATSSMSRRERVAVPSAWLLVWLLGSSPAVHAEMFDYELLRQAQRYYDAGQYGRAAGAWYRYARGNGDDARALYNSASALYRQGSYAAAAKLWAQVHTSDRLLQFSALHNLGNAYAKLGGTDRLKAAIRAYESALRLQNDPQTRENLERVKGRLMRLMRSRMGLATGVGRGGGEASGPHNVPKARKAPVPKTAERKRKLPRNGDAGRTPPGEMSDFEAKMWYGRLDGSADATHLYKITPETAKRRDDADPW